MKYFSFLLLSVFLLHHSQEENTPQEYVAFTSNVDRLMVSEGQQVRVIPKSTILHHTQYYFSVTDPTTATISLESEDCEYPPSLNLWGKTENTATEKIYLQSGQSISIEACFQHQTIQPSQFKSSLDWLLSLFSKAREGRLECPRFSASLGSGKEHGDTLIQFVEADSSIYYDFEHFKVDLYIYDSLIIEEITLTNSSQDGALLCAAGDSTILKDIYGEEVQRILEVEELLQPLLSDSVGMKKYQINAVTLAKHLYQKIDLGTDFYQLNLLVTTDTTHFHRFNFSLITDEQKVFFEQFRGAD